MGPYISFAHGAHVAFLDGIGLGVGLSEEVGSANRVFLLQTSTQNQYICRHLSHYGQSVLTTWCRSSLLR
jgi:hypothetical protein